MSTIFRLALLSVLAIAASVRPATACSCAVFPLCTTFWQADAVFIARAEVTPLGPGAQRARFEVEESFRGPTGGVIEIVGRGIGGSCAYGFVQGTRYLVFARRAPDGTWSSFLCSSTAPLTEAGEAITFARGIARDKSRGGSVSGHALAAERTSGGRFGSHSPLVSVRIAMREGAREFSTRTDTNGRYTIEGVPPGRYTLTVAASPGVEPVPPATIEIKGPGECLTHPVTAVKRPSTREREQ